jgi:hypothetical protein
MCMVCLRCSELASGYHKVLRTYVDLLEFRKLVERRGRTFVLVQARIAEIENRLGRGVVLVVRTLQSAPRFEDLVQPTVTAEPFGGIAASNK